MESTKTRKAKKAKQSLAVGALAFVGLAAVTTGALQTGALFTDSNSVGGNSFTTGNVAISATKNATTQLSLSNMAPGDVKYGEVTVANEGSLALRYAVSQSATNTDAKGLAAGLNLQAKSGVATCDAAGFAGGTALNGTANTFNSATVFGNSAAGSQAGDRVLAAGANEKICFKVELPLAAANALQGATTTGTFTFAAEQTVNN